MAKLWPWEAHAPKLHLAYFVPIDGHFGQVFEIWTSNLFCRAILSPKKPLKTHQSGHISKPHFAQVAFTKKPTPPTFFNEFV